jgi:alkanesulfonate monooxygenase SsuD/methylene tetrahydromethanopterin reductase-like flavin-dependent oxidoreductase (luciferase family)
MTTRERAYAKASNQRAAQYTEMWIVGSPEDLAVMLRAAARTGRLVYVSAPHQMGPDDTRHRRYLRLRTH